ncbi:MAG: hypothetical protein WC889_11510 [Myxococcota bacterium]|jgi:hypothetical protein
MAQMIKNAITTRLGGLRKEIWKLGTVPYNTAIIMATVAIMVESQAWKIREA